jgi:type IV pilus assembly protein PilV
MNKKLDRAPGYCQRGMTLLEVLITIVILAFGLLGLAGLQGRMQVAEFEAYQRTQAVVLLQEMVDRVIANGKNIDYKDINVEVGTGATQPLSTACATQSTTKARDLCEWHHALLGASEKKGTTNLGAMIAARGCIENVNNAAGTHDMPREFLVSVVWQGLSATAPPASTTCGQASYTDAATRRAVVARLTIPCLQNVAATTTCVTP